MTLVFRRTVEDSPAGTGLATFSTSGFGTPKLVILRTTYANNFNTDTPGAGMAMGVLDGVDQLSVSLKAEDDDPLPLTFTESSSANALEMRVESGNSNLIEATFVSFGPDQVQLNFSTVPASTIKIEVLWFTGTDLDIDVHLSNHASGDDVVTGLSFEPRFWLVYGDGDGIPASSVDAKPSIGFAALDYADQLTQACVGALWDTNDVPTIAGSLFMEDWACVDMAIGSVANDYRRRYRIASPTASGYTIEAENPSIGDNILVIAFGFNGTRTCEVGIADIPTTATPFTLAVNAGHESEFVFIGATRPTATFVSGDTNDGTNRDVGAESGSWGWGIAHDQNGGEQGSLHLRYRDGQTPNSEAGSRIDNSVLVIPLEDGSLGAGAVVGSWAGGNAYGFSLDLSANDTGTGRRFLWASIGDGFVLKPDPVVLSLAVPTQGGNTLGYLVPAPVQLLLSAREVAIPVPTSQTPDPVLLGLSAPEVWTGFVFPEPVVLSLSADPLPVLIAPSLPAVLPAPLGEAYLAALQDLLPGGEAWTRHSDAVLTALLRAWAEEYGLVETRATELLTEADPNQTLELLELWEALLRLPDPCLTSAPASYAIRRLEVVSKLTAAGGQSRQYLVDLAAELGWTISVDDVEEFAPFRAGDGAGSRCFSDEWAHVFRLHLPEYLATFARSGAMTAGDPLMEFGSERLTCRIEEVKPAHSFVIFEFDLPAVGYGPWDYLVPTPVVLELDASPSVFLQLSTL